MIFPKVKHKIVPVALNGKETTYTKQSFNNYTVKIIFRLWSLLTCISELTDLIHDYKCKYIWDQIWKKAGGGGGKTDCMGIRNQSESMRSLAPGSVAILEGTSSVTHFLREARDLDL